MKCHVSLFHSLIDFLNIFFHSMCVVLMVPRFFFFFFGETNILLNIHLLSHIDCMQYKLYLTIYMVILFTLLNKKKSLVFKKKNISNLAFHFINLYIVINNQIIIYYMENTFNWIILINYFIYFY